ncbi:sigma-70 family RNA polymerase sigma factor [Pseudonocardia sp. T1-2H]
MIEALPARERTVLTLRFFEDLTQTQIAERVGLSQMHVSRLLSTTPWIEFRAEALAAALLPAGRS